MELVGSTDGNEVGSVKRGGEQALVPLSESISTLADSLETKARKQLTVSTDAKTSILETSARHEDTGLGERVQVKVGDEEGDQSIAKESSEKPEFDSSEESSNGEEEKEEEDEEEERAHITEYHRQFLEQFRRYWRKEGSNGDIDISAFASGLGKLNRSLNKSGKMQRTLLYLLATRRFRSLDGRAYLVRWLMEKHPDLYQAVDDLGHSILGTIFYDSKGDPIIELLIQEFPTQTANLLRSEDPKVLRSLGPDLIRLDCPETLFQHLGERLILSLDGEENTLLHIAARCRQGKELIDVAENQFETVVRIFKACPQALTVLNRRGQSAYQYRLHSCINDLDRMPPRSSDDPISWFLKTEIMNIRNRDTIISLLYGQSQGLEIELDLSEFSNFGTVQKRSLVKLLTSVSFESILSYVHLPRCTWRDGPSDDEYSESPSVSQSEGRYELVFDTLRKLNVKKIVRVIAQDGKIPHRDEDIERMLAGFDVEEWEWEKIDICSEVVFEAAPNVRELSLYSSGNNAVLRSWSAKDGLARLQELKKVNVTLREQLEGPARTSRYVQSFIARMSDCLPSTHLSVITI